MRPAVAARSRGDFPVGPPPAAASPTRSGPTPAQIAWNRIFALIFIIGLGLWLWSLAWPAISGPSSPAAPAAVPTSQTGTVTVIYKLSGWANRADLTYVDGSGNIQQQTGKTVMGEGWTRLSFRVAHGSYVSFRAQNDGDSGTLHCSIDANGVKINTGDASGGYAIVTCSATVPQPVNNVIGN